MRELLSVHLNKGSCLRGTTYLRYSIRNNIVRSLILGSVNKPFKVYRVYRMYRVYTLSVYSLTPELFSLLFYTILMNSTILDNIMRKRSANVIFKIYDILEKKQSSRVFWQSEHLKRIINKNTVRIMYILCN